MTLNIKLYKSNNWNAHNDTLFVMSDEASTNDSRLCVEIDHQEICIELSAADDLHAVSTLQSLQQRIISFTYIGLWGTHEALSRTAMLYGRSCSFGGRVYITIHCRLKQSVVNFGRLMGVNARSKEIEKVFTRTKVLLNVYTIFIFKKSQNYMNFWFKD